MSTENAHIANMAKTKIPPLQCAVSIPCSRQQNEQITSVSLKNGQELAGKGELVFEGELLEIPTWN